MTFVGMANIKVVGVGGAGGNAINPMNCFRLKGVEFIAVNTTPRSWNKSREKRVQMVSTLLTGWGRGESGSAVSPWKKAAVKSVSSLVSPICVHHRRMGGERVPAARRFGEIARESGA